MDTETLIAEVLARPAIWKSTHPQHKFKHVIQKQWEQIKQKVPDVEVIELKRKWKNLKDTYRKELKRTPKSQSGELAPNHESCWRYFNDLDFLREECMGIQAENGNDSSFQTKFEENIYAGAVIEQPAAPSPRSPSPTVPEPSTSGTQNSQNVSKKRKAEMKIDDIRAEYLEIERKKLKILEQEMQNQRQTEDQTSDDYYFLMSLLPEMRKLPPLNKMRLRNRINRALMDEMTTTPEVVPESINEYEEPYESCETKPCVIQFDNFNNE